ncbi:MAG TPA: 50S ribosomal protein L6 [Candidatus Paceibacterota bacterium]
MSRVGKQKIKIPIGITIKADASPLGTTIVAKGPRGELSRLFRPDIIITVGVNEISLTPQKEATEGALWGTYASHVKNMIAGVASGFTKQLIIEGIGYKGAVAGQTLTLNVGFSHPVTITAPPAVKIVFEKNLLTISGPSKEAVGQFAASVRAIKPPDPYKEKGIRYVDEKIIRKQGKKIVS